MRTTLLAATMFALAMPVGAAQAQSGRQEQGYPSDGRSGDQGTGRDQRQADVGAKRNWRDYRNYDENRFEDGQDGYDASRYYRSGGHYQARDLSADDRVYRGQDSRYYCRRSDGTTGLIVGGVAGGLLGNALDIGGNGMLGTLLGAGGGALAGRAIQRNRVRCN